MQTFILTFSYSKDTNHSFFIVFYNIKNKFYKYIFVNKIYTFKK